MKTQQGFYKYKSPHNLHVVNINYYNNYSSMNKYNTLYNTNYNNNNNNNNRKYNESNNSYLSKRMNTENDDKFFVKSQNFFSKNYKSINNAQRKKKNYSISTSSNKNPSKTNTNFYLANTFHSNAQDQLVNVQKNLTTLPSIKVGYFANNINSNIINNNYKTKNKINNSYDKTFFNKKINNTFRNENNSYVNNIKIINSYKNNNTDPNNNNHINNDVNNNGISNNNNYRYYQNTNFFSPTKISPIKNMNFISKNNHNNVNNHNNGLPSLNLLLKERFFSYRDAKYSEKSFDTIAAYGVNTYKGTIRNYNEDRISVVVNAKYSNTQKLRNVSLPKVSFFAIYDGHAGNKCCEFLKSNLHNYIFESSFFPDDPIKAIEQGFNNCEKKFVESVQVKNKINNKFRNNKNNQFNDFSGSCSIIILIIDDLCYTVNLGDSRALYSYNSGNNFYQLSRDHKPNDPIEKERIYKAGGSIFKSNIEQYGIHIKESELGFKIPFRILPGRLAVSKYLYLLYFINI
jgi:hypothetical protein